MCDTHISLSGFLNLSLPRAWVQRQKKLVALLHHLHWGHLGCVLVQNHNTVSPLFSLYSIFFDGSLCHTTFSPALCFVLGRFFLRVLQQSASLTSLKFQQCICGRAGHAAEQSQFIYRAQTPFVTLSVQADCPPTSCSAQPRPVFTAENRPFLVASLNKFAS